MDAIRVPYRSVEFARPRQCFLNATLAAEVFGGTVVFGWRVAETPFHYELQHHGVWQDQEGQVWDVTPWVGMYEDGSEVVLERDCQFVADEEADPELAGVLLNRYVAKVAWAEQACEYLRRADAALYAGDKDRAVYWNRRANQLYHKHGVHYDLPGVVSDPDVANWQAYVPAFG